MNIIKRSTEFQQVFKNGKWYSADILMIYILKNNQNIKKVGIAVGKKVSNRSTKRNRIKRLIREAYRKNEELLVSGYNVVIVCKAGVDFSTINFEIIQSELMKCFNKAELIKNS